MTVRMPSLSAEQMVRVWELGQRQHPLDRALTCLMFALPGASWELLANLSVGQRDAYLLALREQTFGPQLNSLATCPECQEQLEFSLTTTDLRIAELAPLSINTPPKHQCQVNDLTLQFRLPNSVDLAAVVAETDSALARQQLAQRCLVQVEQAGQVVEMATMPEDAIAALSQHLVEVDPQAEILLDLACPACEHQWQILFDISDFFWIELAAQAKQLLIEVHRLARFYGWRETDILTMTNLRRQYYLELVG